MRTNGLPLAGLAAAMIATGALADVPNQTGFSMFVARMAATALPYAAENRWDSYLTICRLAEMLHNEGETRIDIATTTTETFSGYPVLVLTDNDHNRRADVFAYHETESRELTQEFGVFFGMGDAPAPAWIVFNNSMIPSDISADEWEYYWATHHFVDRNGDGRIDLYIGNGADQNGDGTFGIDETEWAFDDDFDGGVDRGEVNIAGRVRPVVPVDGMFQFRGLGKVADGTRIYGMGDGIASDIAEALAEADR